MTKRIASKHKVDRRLKANLWGHMLAEHKLNTYPDSSNISQIPLKLVTAGSPQHPQNPP